MTVVAGLQCFDHTLLYFGAQPVVPVIQGLLLRVDYASGFVAGNAAGFVTGTALGRGHGMAIAESYAEQIVEEALDRGAALGFPIAFRTGVAAAPVGETVPPIIGTVSPTANTTPGTAGAFPATWSAAKDVPIAIPVIDAASAVVFVVLSVHYGDLVPAPGSPFGIWETVYAGRPAIDGVAGYRDGYAAHSTVTGSGAPGVGFTFSARRDDGWPQRSGLALPVSIDTKAVDGKGNVLA